MTYVELLCALALLSLIVVMFTPMLLSSYDTIYRAGERVEQVYDSKEEIEKKVREYYYITLDKKEDSKALQKFHRFFRYGINR